MNDVSCSRNWRWPASSDGFALLAVEEVAMWQIHRCAPASRAKAKASVPARFEASEKSAANTILLKLSGPSCGGFEFGAIVRTGDIALRIRCSAVDPSRKRPTGDFGSVPTTI